MLVCLRKETDLTALGLYRHMNARHYDIVRRENETKLLWLGDAADLETAKSRIEELASQWPGEFEVLDQSSYQIVAKVVSSPETHPRKPKNGS